MNLFTNSSVLVPTFSERMSQTASPAVALNAEDAAPVSVLSPSGGLDQEGRASSRRPVEAASVYVADDNEGLTELYTIFLRGRGFRVQAFNHRAKALEALVAARKAPDLLIMDYLGDSMPVETFLRQCRAVQPSLRILMASGLNMRDARFKGARPDGFIQKPFTAAEFLRMVEATLAGE